MSSILKADTPQPATGQRIESIDATRGVALFLILFSHCVQSFFATHSYVGTGAADIWSMKLFAILSFHKSMMLFALLFGLSFFFQIRKAAAQGGTGNARGFLARLGWLALFGYINGVFDRWDMLLPFALCGLVLPLLWRLPTCWLFAAALILLCHPLSQLCSLLDITDPLQRFLQMHLPAAPDTQASSWSELAAWNISARIPWILAKLYLNQRVFDVTGMFLLGFCLGRSRILEPQGAGRLLHVCCGLAALLLLGYAVRHSVHAANGAFKLFMPYLDVIQALSYAAFFSLLFNWRPMACPRRFMAGIGKSTLSCYMSQGVILSFLMYGWGLGWAETLSASQKAMVAIIVFLFQMAACELLLKKWRLCPMEMLWRHLVSRSVNASGRAR